MSGAGRERLAIALDVALPRAEALYAQVAPHVGYAKIGLSLFVEHGPWAVRALQRQGAKVFLDLKLHDIPNTVELAARQAGALGVALLTVHASGGKAMLEAAVRGAAEGARGAGVEPPRILAVTVLTSLTDPELTAAGFAEDAARTAERLALLARSSGVTGLVCSPREAGTMRRLLGPGMFLCTPGIRPAGAAAGDQARAETPAFARAAGADLLVVGRPIYEAADPAAAAAAIAAEVVAG